MLKNLVQDLCSKIEGYIENLFLIRLLKIENPKILTSSCCFYWFSPVLGMVTINYLRNTISICSPEDFRLDSRFSVPLNNIDDLAILLSEINSQLFYIRDKYDKKPFVPDIDYDLDYLTHMVIDILTSPVYLIRLPEGSSWDQDQEVLFWFDEKDKKTYKIDPKNSTIEFSFNGADYIGLDSAFYGDLADLMSDYYQTAFVPVIMDNTPFSFS